MGGEGRRKRRKRRRQLREGEGKGFHQWKVINFANLPNLSLLHRRGGKHWNGEKKRRNQKQRAHPDKLINGPNTCTLTLTHIHTQVLKTTALIQVSSTDLVV